MQGLVGFISVTKILVGICWHAGISNGDGFQFDYLCRRRRLLIDGCWLAPYDLQLLVTDGKEPSSLF